MKTTKFKVTGTTALMLNNPKIKQKSSVFLWHSGNLG